MKSTGRWVGRGQDESSNDMQMRRDRSARWIRDARSIRTLAVRCKVWSSASLLPVLAVFAKIIRPFQKYVQMRNKWELMVARSRPGAFEVGERRQKSFPGNEGRSSLPTPTHHLKGVLQHYDCDEGEGRRDSKTRNNLTVCREMRCWLRAAKILFSLNCNLYLYSEALLSI